MPAQIDDRAAMLRALRLAARGLPWAHPNPAVGCVILARSGAALGEGWHRGPGTPHAEVVALAQAGRRAAGGTAYVTLEPCAHQGRTGPCTAALQAAGLARVVVAMLDPDERVRGQGMRRLREGGLQCEVGLLGQEAAELDAGYLTHRSEHRPRVVLKFAASLDGRVATASGASRWITSPALRRLGHRLRHLHEAVLVGSGTALADDPRLDTRLAGRGTHGAWRQPLRVVLDARGRLPAGARLLAPPGRALVATTAAASEASRQAWARAGTEVLILPAGTGGGVSWPALLKELGKRDVLSVLVEGGPTVAGSALAAGCVDDVVAHLAPILIGGSNAPGAIGEPGAATLEEAWRISDPRWRRVGSQMVVSGALHPIRPWTLETA